MVLLGPHKLANTSCVSCTTCFIRQGVVCLDIEVSSKHFLVGINMAIQPNDLINGGGYSPCLVALESTAGLSTTKFAGVQALKLTWGAHGVFL